MISIIICSRKADISQELKDNIASTIGCEYELCVIDNSRNDYNIFTAYNEGVRRAKGDILCFMHEDIVFLSNLWGQVVVDFFEKHEEAGLLGVVGGQFIPDTPAYWGDGGCDYGVIKQGYYDEKGTYLSEIRGNAFDGRELEVAAVDGQWFCIPKALFNKIEFDTASYSGFHSYDIDICMQIAVGGRKLYITNDILIEHKSTGSDSIDFMLQNGVFYQKWKEHLPIVRGRKFSNQEIQERTRMVQRKQYYWKQYLRLEQELAQIKNSYAYRIGKFILHPLKVLKRK